MTAPTYDLGELVYLTNRLARGSPDPVFTDKNGPGMVIDILVKESFKPRYKVRWLKSDLQMVFHDDVLMAVPEPEP
tara:strand:- start:101 stop:328 length:228 start_codon:yes stop_codon:yes gene_type:complete